MAVLEFVPSSEIDFAAAKWEELERRLLNSSITNSWCWVQTWVRHFGAEIPHTFAFALDHNRPVGAALLTHAPLEMGPISIPALFIGTAGESRRESTHLQYNKLLAAPEDLHSFAECLMIRLVRFKWSVLKLNGFDPDHAEALMRAGRRMGMRFQLESALSFSYDFRNAGADEDIISTLSRDTRSKMRRSVRFLAERLGPVSVEWAETMGQAHDIVDELIGLHTTQWNAKGEKGDFHTQRLRQYHKELVDALFPRHLIAFRVKQGDTTIGCLLNLVENGHITNHRSGVRLFPDDNRLKPGYITDILFMEEARKRGYAEYDLLVGHEYYKRLITNTEHTLIWAMAGRGLRSQVYEVARNLYWDERARPFIRRIEKAANGKHESDRQASPWI